MTGNARWFTYFSSATLIGVDVVFLATARAEARDTRAHVRPMDERASMLVQDTAERSPTVAAIIADIERTDVIVNLQVTFIPHETAGYLRYVTTTATSRILIVRIRATLPPWEQAAVLGHELQHAREIAAAPTVRDRAAVAALFESIGYRTDLGTYETDAAVRVTSQVRWELTGATKTRRSPTGSGTVGR